MPQRLAACEPCRTSKLACDHSKPICSRCRDSDQPSSCVYRERPFKRRRVNRDAVERSFGAKSRERTLPESSTPHDPPPSVRTTSRKYPNPGYLGRSSHTAIFENLSPKDASNDAGVFQQGASASVTDDGSHYLGAELVREICELMQVHACKRLVDAWSVGGVNLAVAAPLILACSNTVEMYLTSYQAGQGDALELAKKLFANSCMPLNAGKDSSFEHFVSSFCVENVRWETIGLFFAAVARAACDSPHFPPLYNTRQERWTFHRIATHLSNRCLDIALALDCLNILQFVLQFENYINFTHVYGDQSYHPWRKLGDLISSLFALGYHQEGEQDRDAPLYFAKLKRVASAQVYSADKDVSLFLGRPPRIHLQYCKFQVNGLRSSYSDGQDAALTGQLLDWPEEGGFDYAADAKWAAMCAALKEDILGLIQLKDVHQREQASQRIQDDAEAQWTSLPRRLRLEGSLRSCAYGPVERDFLLGAKLNHLHILFLLRLTQSRHLSTPDASLLSHSASILSLVVDALLQRNRLANSGTNLVWKVSFYGLPSAGILCLSLLNQSFVSRAAGLSFSAVIQDLSVLVAEVERGTFVDVEEPNYPLLASATKAIRSLLDRLLSGSLGRNLIRQETELLSGRDQSVPEQDWMPWAIPDAWDFELEFWNNLVEHPTLAGADEHQSR